MEATLMTPFNIVFNGCGCAIYRCNTYRLFRPLFSCLKIQLVAFHWAFKTRQRFWFRCVFEWLQTRDSLHSGNHKIVHFSYAEIKLKWHIFPVTWSDFSCFSPNFPNFNAKMCFLFVILQKLRFVQKFVWFRESFSKQPSLEMMNEFSGRNPFIRNVRTRLP